MALVANGTSRWADRVDEDQRNARRNPAPSRLFRRLPHNSEFRVKRPLEPVRIVSRIDEHHPAHILRVRSGKDSDVETAK